MGRVHSVCLESPGALCQAVFCTGPPFFCMKYGACRARHAIVTLFVVRLIKMHNGNQSHELKANKCMHRPREWWGLGNKASN